ncbi:hypothetical protein DL239_18940 [Sedimentitalea sp. CY04]|uniref:Uncharacterized protein n=1 Tax=Parasedimentitalea denitrificans TaxID=2211118 RepID=A0ABX0WFD3_9RHOB|nr:hypothetical protein [Sedimentitalea sp. CY04]NIZ63046.1 hypothetical protein [Sedimentitalea sp. CY04]
MADALPNIDFVRTAEAEYVVIIDDAQKTADLTQLLTMVPGLAQPEAATTLAKAVNHISQGRGFSVITDPSAFAQAYNAQLAGEDVNTPWQEGVIRLVDFGVPDFDEIQAPSLVNDQLVFFARDGFTGLPYRVETSLGAIASVSEDSYKALDLEPVEDDEEFDDEGELSEEDRAFMESLETVTHSSD